MYPDQTDQKTKTYAQPGVPIHIPITYPGQNPYPYAQPLTRGAQTTCGGPNCSCCQPCEVVFKEKIYQQPLTYLQPTPIVVQQSVYQQPGFGSGAAGFGSRFVYGQAVEKSCCYGQQYCYHCC